MVSSMNGQLKPSTAGWFIMLTLKWMVDGKHEVYLVSWWTDFSGA